jgi:hypothetical protein
LQSPPGHFCLAVQVRHRALGALRRALDGYLERRGPLHDVEGTVVELRDLDDGAPAAAGRGRPGHGERAPGAAGKRAAREWVAAVCIRENQAAALLRIADGRAVTVDKRAAEFEMSRAGARVFAHCLLVEALVRTEPAPQGAPGIALRLASGTANELAAVLAPVGGIAAGQPAALVQTLDDDTRQSERSGALCRRTLPVQKRMF